ncbi:MAG TPA: hypothetical protein ENJ56_02445 [Anaerolineae bacterium]|nr:hypothetical protein [Anaerolineae bacterium]
MNDIYFGDDADNVANPPQWTLNSGGRAQIKAENDGSLEHNWAIIKAGATVPDSVTDAAAIKDIILFDVGNVAGGASTNATFDIPDAGEYTVICTVAGHYPTMQGKLVVK